MTTPAVDMRSITDTINGALASAGLTSENGVARSVSETIERALASAGLATTTQRGGGEVTTLGPRFRGDDILAVAKDVTARESSVDADTSNVVELFRSAGGGEFLTR